MKRKGERAKKAVLVTGTPGTGKSTLAKKLSLSFKKKLINLTDFARKHDLFERYDRERDTYEVDTEKLAKILKEEIAKSEDTILIEGHLAHYLPEEMSPACIVCRTELKQLKERLTKRGYSQEKVRENLDSEIFETILTEARENGHKIIEIDTTGKPEETLEKAKERLKALI
ncbi:MAG: adenylate kinase family protein [Nanobdellota archaeon]